LNTLYLKSSESLGEALDHKIVIDHLFNFTFSQKINMVLKMEGDEVLVGGTPSSP
jgi:hypothetical protein